MAVRGLEPITPGQRHKIIGIFEEITVSVLERSLVYGKKLSGGRNNEGEMAMCCISGGHRKVIRIVDFRRNKDGVPAMAKAIEYDPNRSARIALLYHTDGEKRYIIAPNGSRAGATLMSDETAASEIGNTLPLQNILVGIIIRSIELRSGQDAALVRSAGNFAQLTSREGRYCVVKLPSGEVRQILSACKVAIGGADNSGYGLERSSRAGCSRWQGRHPRNRGAVMNPVDHPMGDGERRSFGGRPRSHRGLHAKRLKTRVPKKRSSKYITERRKE